MSTRRRRHGQEARPDAYDACPECGRPKRRKVPYQPNSGCFRKGDPNLTARLQKPLGSERIDTKSGEVLIKVADENPWLPGTGSGLWVPRRRVNWEAANGPIPKDLIVRRLTDDPLDDDPEHMVVITRSVNVALNHGRWTRPARPWKHLPPDMELRRIAVAAAIAHSLAHERAAKLPKETRLLLRRRRA